MFDLNQHVGVLGGGQLGKMLGIAAANWHLPIHFLDHSVSFPAGIVASTFTEGNFKSYEDVYNFGKKMDILTIEIEHVNTEALHQLEKEGKIIHPRPEALDLIKDKGLQKLFYQKHGIPTASFEIFEGPDLVKKALASGAFGYPFVQKSRTAGYDGRGVAVIRSSEDLSKLLEGPCLIEEMADIEKELAVVVARNAAGDVRAFPAVEMAFNPVANLVEFLFAPASITPQIEKQAENLACSVIESFDICGLLAVELFLNKDGSIWVNEVAPRPHNSGHHSIDSSYTSQYEQHLRGILNLPLGNTDIKTPSVMVNLLGAEGFEGPAFYEGIERCMAIDGVKIHLYGKAMTKPYRKMGHVTIVDQDLESAKKKAYFVQENLIIKSKN